MMRALIALLLLSAVLLPQTAISQGADWAKEEQELQKHLQLWRSRNIARYDVHVDSNCFGCFYYYPAILSVRDREIVAITDPETGAPLSKTIEGLTITPFPEELDNYWSIDDLFEAIESAIQSQQLPLESIKARSMTVVYDEDYGFPTNLYIRNGYEPEAQAKVNDSSLSARLSNFTPVP